MKRYTLMICYVIALLAVGSAAMLTGCDDESDWPYSPPPGWGANYFYDSRLNGVWELTMADANPVTRFDTNYLDFYGQGHGRYYYYSNTRPLSEEIAYFCQKSDSNTTNYQINIQYASGTASTMAYWFSDNNSSLWMQWKVGNRIVTYLYSRTGATPW